jgi:signal transduction histidine kinase
LAEDLAFGIGTLRARAARERKVRLLREEVERDARKQLAATLHDGVAQSVQAVNLGLKRLRAVGTREGRMDSDLLSQIIDDVSGVIAELRDVSHELRPPFLERMELTEAIQYYCSELSERTGISIRVAKKKFVADPGARVREQCFLSFREALSNAIKHGKASRIDVVLRSTASDSLVLKVTDDGIGFDTERTFSAPSGLGLSMIRERAESIGGSAEIRSMPGKGTRVKITVPTGADLMSAQLDLTPETIRSNPDVEVTQR